MGTGRFPGKQSLAQAILAKNAEDLFRAARYGSREGTKGSLVR
jgi:hypothetical protein